MPGKQHPLGSECRNAQNENDRADHAQLPGQAPCPAQKPSGGLFSHSLGLRRFSAFGP